MPLTNLLVAILSMVCAGGLAYVFIHPYLSGNFRGEKRKTELARSTEELKREKAKLASRSRNKRSAVEEAIADMERKQKNAQNPPIHIRITQAGLDWSKQKFIVISAVLGLACFLLAFINTQNLLTAALAGILGGLGAPRLFLHIRKKKREAAFLNEFPNSIDVIVRGVKAGLPLGDCIKMIANEAQEPVKTEFQSIVETQTIGLPLGDACARLYERMPIPEANFFGIVIMIQQKAGGSLSDALSNLSKVLRERKRMKAKIQAMSMEAKASAAIIAALPVTVMLLVYMTSPRYIEMLWTTDPGKMMLMASAGWMLTGVLVMRKMINFDF